MTAAVQHDRTFWLQFIKEYELLPCLWNDKHPNFASKKAREQALNILLKKVRQVWPSANIDFVKQRISNFRRTFINEYNKVENSKKSGFRRYVPSLYYYNHLIFLKQDRKPDLSPESNCDDASDEECHFQLSTAKEEDYQNQEIPTSDYSGEVDFIITSKEGSSPSNELYMIASSNNEEPRPNKRQRLQQEPTENISHEVHTSSEYQFEEESEHVSTALVTESQNRIKEKSESEISDNSTKNAGNWSTQVISEDEFDVISKRVAMHFRKMSPEQCLYAEKLVFDVCIGGRLNRLSEDSTLLFNNSKRQKTNFDS